MTNIYGNKKKSLSIAKAIPWLKKAKALLDYKFCELTIKYGKKSIVVKCCYWTTPPVLKQNQEEEQLNESDNNESDEKKDQEEQKKTAELVYTIFISNGKLLNNVKVDKKEIMINGKLICWPYYDILRKTFNRKPGKKAKYKVQKFFENKPPEIQSLVAEQRKPFLKEKKVNIENLLAKNSPVISKEGNTPG
ncbi:hypothetical protein G9A89_010975 [Geosiphon pyriformis]|nr:hypothetical protein G9A89_010975 [Geosiphon pyriformis]